MCIPLIHKGFKSVNTLLDPLIDAVQVYTPASVGETCVNVRILLNVDNEPLIIILSVIISSSLNQFTTSEETSEPIALVRLIVHTIDTSSPIT